MKYLSLFLILLFLGCSSSPEVSTITIETNGQVTHVKTNGNEWIVTNYPAGKIIHYPNEITYMGKK